MLLFGKRSSKIYGKLYSFDNVNIFYICSDLYNFTNLPTLTLSLLWTCFWNVSKQVYMYANTPASKCL